MPFGGVIRRLPAAREVHWFVSGTWRCLELRRRQISSPLQSLSSSSCGFVVGGPSPSLAHSWWLVAEYGLNGWLSPSHHRRSSFCLRKNLPLVFRVGTRVELWSCFVVIGALLSSVVACLGAAHPSGKTSCDFLSGCLLFFYCRYSFSNVKAASCFNPSLWLDLVFIWYDSYPAHPFMLQGNNNCILEARLDA